MSRKPYPARLPAVIVALCLPALLLAAGRPVTAGSSRNGSAFDGSSSMPLTSPASTLQSNSGMTGPALTTTASSGRPPAYPGQVRPSGNVAAGGAQEIHLPPAERQLGSKAANRRVDSFRVDGMPVRVVDVSGGGFSARVIPGNPVSLEDRGLASSKAGKASTSAFGTSPPHLPGSAGGMGGIAPGSREPGKPPTACADPLKNAGSVSSENRKAFTGTNAPSRHPATDGLDGGRSLASRNGSILSRTQNPGTGNHGMAIRQRVSSAGRCPRRWALGTLALLALASMLFMFFYDRAGRGGR